MEGCRRGRADRELLHAPRGDRSHFRPLAGLSCINLLSNRTYDGRTYNGFRPLAGLSCINLSLWMLLTVGELRAFPSPRGVELHKPLA